MLAYVSILRELISVIRIHVMLLLVQDLLAEHISARDRQALEYLVDVRFERGNKGMLVEFLFLENPYFENKVDLITCM